MRHSPRPREDQPWSNSPQWSLGIPTHSNTTVLLTRVSQPVLQTGPRVTGSLAHLDWWYTSPLFLSRAASFPKNTDLLNFVPMADEGFLGVRGTEATSKLLRWWVTGSCDSTPKPCRGAKKPPGRALLLTSHQNPPLRERLRREGRRRYNLLSHSNPHAHTGAPSLPAPQLPRKSGTGAGESGLELPPPPRAWAVAAEGQGLDVDLRTPPSRSPQHQRSQTLRMRSLLFAPQVSKVPKPRATPLTLSLGLCSREPWWWED